MRGCCRPEPLPLISQRKREAQSGDDVYPGSHSWSVAVSSLPGSAFYATLVRVSGLSHRPSWGHGSSCLSSLWFSSRVCIKGPMIAPCGLVLGYYRPLSPSTERVLWMWRLLITCCKSYPSRQKISNPTAKSLAL